MSRTRLAAALVVSALALAGCGGSDSSSGGSDSAPASSSAAPATGDAIKADDFTFNAPDGWKQNDGSAMPSVNFLAVAADPEDKDGFADNINVISDPTLTRVDSVDELEKAIEKVLNGVAKDVKVQDSQDVDGDEAAVATAAFTQGTLKYKTLQYAVRHDDKGYVVTFSFSNDRPAAEQEKVAESVMASWAWAS